MLLGLWGHRRRAVISIDTDIRRAAVGNLPRHERIQARRASECLNPGSHPLARRACIGKNPPAVRLINYQSVGCWQLIRPRHALLCAALLVVAVGCITQVAHSQKPVAVFGTNSNAGGPVSGNQASEVLESSDEWLTPEERTNIAVYDRCNRSVVHINTQGVRPAAFLTSTKFSGTGSGSVIDHQGYILTNHHVIESAREISVGLANGVSYPAMLVGQDPDSDIAVLKIDAPEAELVPIEWGDSKNLRVGQKIFAIGNPFGLERTMSTGIISSLNRQFQSKRGMKMRWLIQIDAALNQGNSGGPLINTRGQLIGMNTAIVSSNGDSAGVGFAIPVSTIRRIVPQLIRDGKVIRPTIGITRVYDSGQGLLIVTLTKDGPAEKAGLKGFSITTKRVLRGAFGFDQATVNPATADLIEAIDGVPVDDVDDLLGGIENKLPGDTVWLDIVRSENRIRVPVKLGSSE